MITFATLSSGCAESVNDSVAVAPSTFCEAKSRVEALRRERRSTSKQTVKLTLKAPVMPQPLSARGAVAFAPPHDLRMILIGPGGGTALDLWMHDRSFRLNVPPIGRVVRGDEHTPPEKKRGLPVDFLNWWILDPLGGQILFAETNSAGIGVVLRKRNADGTSAYVDATIASNGRVDATRTSWSGAGDKIDEETVHATSLECGCVDYTQASTGLVVQAICEAASAEVSPRAFVDPDKVETPP